MSQQVSHKNLLFHVAQARKNPPRRCRAGESPLFVTRSYAIRGFSIKNFFLFADPRIFCFPVIFFDSRLNLKSCLPSASSNGME
ncbi:hypothetical protein Sp245p_27060 (plasmid) [Azospirillum baldaniorum]|uniref:Uncharacterized protein n=1 Tax=Azospirillum baldaniorum TaxID=1064539 RepID=A0A9P1K1Y5_9PROT|nr:hypothetical protein Sp245p_26455 [Azospirillum baldaniorum]AWJ93518.1 hypothetical protein Sp245p_27060 [Azospirillum baldaniorum]CCD04044.1 protein of unknown function [Azospirillum baldaniorum]